MSVSDCTRTQMEVLLIESHEILNIAREGQEKGKLKDEGLHPPCYSSLPLTF